MVFEDSAVPTPEGTSYVVYDGDCPFCSAYVKFVRLRDVLGNVSLLNAREPHEIIDYLRSKGVVLNQEMALVTGRRVFSGPDCINQLALLSTRSNTLNKINALLFSSPRTARIAYPIMRAARNATLRVMRRDSLPV